LTRLDKPLEFQPVPLDTKRPPEMKTLEKLVGDWETHVGIKTKGKEAEGKVLLKLIARPILGGRMIESIEGGLPGVKDKYWLCAFDANRRSYRIWHFNAKGDVTTLGGGWDEKAQTLVWNQAYPSGQTRIDTWRWPSADRFEGTTIMRDAVGKTVTEVQFTSTRKGK
jgi:hypothetical protein